jgi:hypothetical protein
VEGLPEFLVVFGVQKWIREFYQVSHGTECGSNVRARGFRR